MSDDKVKRVSNERILTALEALPVAIAAAMGTVATAAPIADSTESSEDDNGLDKIQVDAAYLSHVSAKLQDRANDTGETYVLYARKNKAGETKLAYCLGSAWSALTDRRIIGAVKTVSPE